MLIGSFHHTLEQKGRLAIPPGLRKALGEKPIITTGLETCLQILPFNTWSKLTADLGAHPLSGSPQREIRRLLAHSASQISYDSQGRISIPHPLIVSAKLTKKVVIAGSIDWIEIWDLDLYTQHLSKINSQRINLSQRLAGSHE